jgi:hypothetical protein
LDNENQSLGENINKAIHKFLELGPKSFKKYFFISGGVLLFLIYVFYDFMVTMLNYNPWLGFLSLSFGGQIIVCIFIIAINCLLTSEALKRMP